MKRAFICLIACLVAGVACRQSATPTGAQSLVAEGPGVSVQTVREGSVVTPGPRHTLAVNGAPFYPLGWNEPGTCTGSTPETGLYRANRDSVRAHLATMRRHGTNTLFETPGSDGRIVARAVDGNWYNWYSYTLTDAAGQRRDAGHVRPGAYVEGMRWLMDQAVGSGEAPMYTMVALSGFITPGYKGNPYDGSEKLSCADYRAFIEEERRQHGRIDPAQAQRIPSVGCEEPAVRPFWEWNVRYVVQSLRDHPGLLGWYLWDEAEGLAYRHLFGMVPPGEPVPPFTGPASLPTPDLLHYAYERVKAFETEGKPPGFARHPLVVDVVAPHVFFSDRFAWSVEGHLDPAWSSGPFDRRPDGRYGVPADVLGMEASALQVYAGGVNAMPRRDWYWDQNFASRTAEMLMDVVRQDGLWAGLVVAAQAQLPSEGGYAGEEPLRCEPNDELYARLLNDRDLIWLLLTTQINGLRGYLYYTHARMPATGPGAEQVRRSNRLLWQFDAAELGDALLTPARDGALALGALTVEALTDYYRRPAESVGAAKMAVARSAFSESRRLPDAAAYRAERFGRTPGTDADQYGHAAYVDPYLTPHPTHRLLRTALHHHQGDDYLFVSNAYDAQIQAELAIAWPEGSADAALEEGLFGLDKRDGFRWDEAPERLETGAASRSTRLTVGLEPYEARVFRLRYQGE